MMKKIFSNWGWKLVAFLIAFGLWFVVVLIENPPGEITFSNISVQLVNTDSLTNQDKVYEVLEDSDLLESIQVKGPTNILTEMKKQGNSTIVATADLSNLSEDGTVPIKVSAISQYASEITDIIVPEKEQNLQLFVENKISKNLPVQVITEGEVAEGYQLDRATAAQNRIEISGGESKVNQVASAGVVLSVAGSDSDISTTETIQLYDAEGNVLDSRLVKKNINSVQVSATVLATKTVPLEYQTSGTVTTGYQVTGITSTPDSIMIAGNENLLNSITSITLPAELLDVTGATGDLERDYNIRSYLPNGVQIAKNNPTGTANITVTVQIEREIQRTFKIQAGNISVTNVPEGVYVQTAEDYQVYDLTLGGLAADIAAIDEDSLMGTVDVSAWMNSEGLTEVPLGRHYLPVSFSLPRGVHEVNATEAWVEFYTEAEEAESTAQP